MSRMAFISVCVVLSLCFGTLNAFGSDDHSLPKKPLVALYCPRNADENSPWANSGLNLFGSVFARPEANIDGAGYLKQKKRISADPDINFGTMGDLTSLNFKTTTGFTPYFGARFRLIDPANNRMVAPRKVAQGEKTNFLPYRLGFGFGCEMNKNLNLNLGYGVALPTQFQYKDAFRNGLEPPVEGSEVSVRIKLNF